MFRVVSKKRFENLGVLYVRASFWIFLLFSFSLLNIILKGVAKSVQSHLQKLFIHRNSS